jgi:hypothetical protein
MKLSAWMDRERKTAEEVGEMLAVHPVTVAKYRTGRQMPRSDVMGRIVAITAGEVQPNDFYPLEPPQPPEPQQAEAG